jgi:hypothetical protein
LLLCYLSHLGSEDVGTQEILRVEDSAKLNNPASIHSPKHWNQIAGIQGENHQVSMDLAQHNFSVGALHKGNVNSFFGPLEQFLKANRPVVSTASGVSVRRIETR